MANRCLAVFARARDTIDTSRARRTRALGTRLHSPLGFIRALISVPLTRHARARAFPATQITKCAYKIHALHLKFTYYMKHL